MKPIYVIIEHVTFEDYYNDDTYETDTPIYYTDSLEDAEFVADNQSTYADELRIIKLPYINKEKLIEQQFQFNYATSIKLVRKEGFFEYDVRSDDSFGKEFSMSKDKNLLDRANMFAFHSNKNNITVHISMDSESGEEHDTFKEHVDQYIQKIKTLLDNAKREGIKSTRQIIDALERLK